MHEIRRLGLVISSIVAGVASGAAPAVAAEADASVRGRRGRTSVTREIRVQGADGEARWSGIARRGSRRDEARWNLSAPLAGGAVLLGSQRYLRGEAGRGWDDALFRRGTFRRPRPSLARTSLGVSWASARPGGLTALALGRDRDGASLAAARGGFRSCDVALDAGGAGPSVALAWNARAAELPFRLEWMRGATARGVRAGIGGREGGLVARVETTSEGKPLRAVAAGARLSRGPLAGTRVRVAVPLVAGSAGVTRRWSVDSGVGAGRWRFRGRAADSRWRGDAARPIGRGSEVVLTLSGAGEEPALDLARVSLALGRGARRGGVRLDLPAAGGRAGSAWLVQPLPSGSRVRVRLGWARGKRTTVEIEWGFDLTRSLPAVEVPRSTP